MTPQEKAKELFDYFYKSWMSTDIYWNPSNDAKEDAIQAVKMISDSSDYWEEVIKEIKNLAPDEFK